MCWAHPDSRALPVGMSAGAAGAGTQRHLPCLSLVAPPGVETTPRARPSGSETQRAGQGHGSRGPGDGTPSSRPPAGVSVAPAGTEKTARLSEHHSSLPHLSRGRRDPPRSVRVTVELGPACAGPWESVCVGRVLATVTHLQLRGTPATQWPQKRVRLPERGAR